MRSIRPVTAAVIILAFLTLVFDYFYLIRDEAPFSWDEAHHSIFSLLIARSLASGDISAFWRHTHSQVYWPFFHSWVSAPFLLVGGYNYAAARMATAFFGAASIFLIYILGRKFFGSAAGALAALLLALSPMYHVLSSTAMIENVGLFLTLILFLLFSRVWEGQGKGAAIGAGALLAVLYLTKYIYGAFFGAALVCFLLSLLVYKAEGIDRARAFRSLPWVAAGFLLVCGPWVLIPPTAAKLKMFFFRVGDTGAWNPFGYSRLDNRLFFIRALYYAYGFSIATYLIYIGGIVFGFVRLREARARFLFFFFLVNFVPMSLIVNSQERFAYLGFPPLLILSAAALVRVWQRLNKGFKWALAAILALLMLGDVPKLPALYRQTANAVLSFNLHRQELRFDYSTFFGLASAPRFIRYPKEYFNPAAATTMPEDTGAVIRYVKSVTDPRYPLCVSAWLGTLPPHLWQWEYYLAGRPVITTWDPNAVYFLRFDVEETSPYNRLGNRHLIKGIRTQAAVLDRLQKDGLVRKTAERRFPGTGLSAQILVRTAPTDQPGWR